MAHWRRRWHADLLPARPLGRPCQHADRQTRQQIIHFINDNGAGVALEAIQAAFPAVARAEAHHLQTRYRRAYRKRHRRHLRVLHWARPGTVWAMDHSDPPRPVDGVYPQMLAIRDLASGYQLAWLPVESKAAEPVLRTLQNLFAQYGPPLVLKCDNGSPFIAEEIQTCSARRVCAPLSPLQTPEYNGSCEAGNGSMKNRTDDLAARAGRFGFWTSDDVEAARCQANEVNYPAGPHGPTPQQLWQGRAPITLETRAAFLRSTDSERPEGPRRIELPPDGRLEPPGPGRRRSCGDPPCSRRARITFLHQEADYSTTSSQKNVEYFVESTLASDVLELSGIFTVNGQTRHGSVHTDVYVLEMGYDPAEIARITGLTEFDAAAAGLMTLGYLDRGPDGLLGTDDDRWTLAVAGNFGSANAQFMGDRPWSDLMDTTLGDYGVDTLTHTVWAVLDHNSQFGVAAFGVPEPATLADAHLHGPRAGRLGVEAARVAVQSSLHRHRAGGGGDGMHGARRG